jgi:hypothetical protein
MPVGMHSSGADIQTARAVVSGNLVARGFFGFMKNSFQHERIKKSARGTQLPYREAG